MSEQVARKFVEALERLEAEGDVEPLVSVFSEGCTIGNVVSPEKFTGREGARRFWGEKYRDTFGEIRSTFLNIFATEDRAALEWVSEGTSVSGTPVRYEGVSILETEGDTVRTFRAYFDAGALARQIAGGAQAGG